MNDYQSLNFGSHNSFGRQVGDSEAIKKAHGTSPERLHGKIIRDRQIKFSRIKDNSRVIVTLQGKDGKTISITEEMLSKHFLFIGSTGCGKTNVMYGFVDGILKNLTENDIVIIMDSKGDFYDLFGEPDNPRHIVIGNHPKNPKGSRAWNVFPELTNDYGRFEKKELKVSAKEISKSLFKSYESSSQPFFSAAAGDIFKNVLIGFCREAQKTHSVERLNNPALLSFLDTATVKTYDDMFKKEGNEDFRSATMYYGDPNMPMTPQALGVLGNINIMKNDLFIGPFGSEAKETFSMRSLVRQKGKRVVFIEYDIQKGKSLGPMYKLMIDLALKQALGGRDTNRGNVYLIIDELRLLEAPDHLGDALNFGRSQNVKVVAAIQSIKQLTDAFGEEAGRVISSGFMNRLNFQCSDVDTRKHISDTFGETFDNYVYNVSGDTISFQRSGHAVEDWDILNLDTGEAYINLIGYEPFKFEFERFKKR